MTGETRPRRYYCVFVCFVIFLSLVTLGHLGLLLYQQTRVLEELGQRSIEAFVHSVPTWLPFAVFVVLIVVCQPCLCFSWCRQTETDKRKDTCRIIRENWKLNVYISIIVGVVTYILQVIVYLWLDLLCYLDLQSLIASCLCAPYTTSSCASLHRCLCRLPFNTGPTTVFTDTPAQLATNETLREGVGLHYTGDVNVTLVGSLEGGTGDTEYPEMQRMLLYLQLCLVVVVFRFPAWIIMQHYEMLTHKLSILNTIRRDLRTHRRQSTQVSQRWQGTVCAALKASKVQQQHRATSLSNTWYCMELCFFCYVEGTDAFTLVEEVVKKPHHFIANQPLTYALLTFISLTLVIISLANLLSLSRRTSSFLSRFMRLFLVVLSNLPFFILRVYMLVAFEGRKGEDTVFLLFTVKEVVLLVLAGAQAGIEVYNAQQEAPLSGLKEVVNLHQPTCALEDIHVESEDTHLGNSSTQLTEDKHS